MSTSDGTVIGRTTLLDNGLPAQRWNLVLVAEGYQESEMDQFANDAQQFVDRLLTTSPFDSLQAAINIFRVDVASTDSGADDPLACGGSGATVNTYFDASFCNNGIQRLLEVNDGTVVNVVNAQVPQWQQVLVIVNSSVYGGSGGTIGVTSTASTPDGWENIAIHEMGHSAFGLADEYASYQGCGIDTDRDNYTLGEPSQPNVTIDSDRVSIKWGDLIMDATPMPTSSNPDCTQCDSQPSPVPAGTVGAFEGADSYHCGVYRPEFDCRMRSLSSPFCAVCQRQISNTLQPFLF